MAELESEQDRAARAVAQWKREFPEWELLPMEVLGRLNEISALTQHDHYAPLFEKYGLQPGEFDVLAALRRSGAPYELTPTELFETTMMSSGGMTARLDRLEKAGHIQRRPNPNDRRGVLVGLTKPAVKLIDEVAPLHLANQTKMTGKLSKTELTTLSALLKKVMAGLG